MKPKNPSRFLFVLGGARSGKSAWAQCEARKRGGRAVLFIATALPHDKEMKRRIARHRRDRAAFGWATWEAVEGSLAEGLSAVWKSSYRLILLDCATLWISRLLCEAGGSRTEKEIETRIEIETKAFLRAWKQTMADLIIVSNEVGMGLVPERPLGRLFRDIQGRFNQRLAAEADEVVLLVAGLPLWLKRHRKESS